MHQFAKSKMVSTMSGLSHDEYRLLGRWLKSPFFNSNKFLIRFHEVLKKYHPEYDHPKCSKEHLFKKIYPSESYRAKLILTLMSDLTKHAEEFLVHQQLKKDPEIREQLLKNSYLQRNQVERYEKRAYNRIKKLEAKEVLERKELLELEQLYEELYFRSNESIKQQPKQDVLKQSNHYLDRYYTLGKYRLLNEMVEREKIMKGDQIFQIDKTALKQLRINLQEPVLDLYFSKIEITPPVKEADYYAIKKQFLESFHLLELKDQKILFFGLINIASRLLIQEKFEIRNEIFDFYKLGLEQNWLIHNNQMNQRTFNNIVSTSNYSGNTSYTKDFIIKYIPFLEPSAQMDAKVWGLAHVYYYEGNYEAAVDQLKSHKFTNYLFNFRVRTLLMKAYFDLCQKDYSFFDFFNYYNLAFEKFLRRDKIFSKKRIDANLNLLKYTKKIISNNLEKKLESTYLEKLKIEIEQDTNLTGKEWLLERIKAVT